MGFYAKKTLTGYKKVDRETSEDAEYYIETIDEHKKELRQLKDELKAAYHAKDKADDEKKEVIDCAKRQTRSYDLQIDEAKKKIRVAEENLEDAEEKVSRLKTKVVALTEKCNDLEEQLQNAQHLYHNMQRIMRERANQARGIKPKKDYDGYLVLESRQWAEKHTKDPSDVGVTWKSILQTPYDASLPLAEVQPLIAAELQDYDVLSDIGCTEIVPSQENGLYHTVKRDNSYAVNVMYRWKYKANYRSGLWEIEIYTTKRLTVPDFRRPTWWKKR